MNRFGIVESKRLDCNLQNMCSFTFEPSKKMLPKATIWVYEILNNKDVLIGGSTTIEFEDLSQNYVSMNFDFSKNLILKILLSWDQVSLSWIFLNFNYLEFLELGKSDIK